MRRSRSRRVARLVVATLGAAAVVALFASPVAAQSINRSAIDDLNEQLLYVALPLVLFVELTLVYALYRFRDNDDPQPTTKDPALEITWTAATGVILLFVGLSAFFVLANPYITPTAAGQSDTGLSEDAVEIEVVAYQWGWEFRYQGEGVTSKSQLVLPRSRDVAFSFTTRDVIHSFYVPELGLKQDIIPGQTTEARTRATETGEYTLYCAELCGVGHTRMHGTVRVVSPTEYEEWLEGRRGE
ncbi:cytochrome c oxidase subunit II [Salinigranum salinum]|uniref:cytochrome c oxidase subunit II n=1 Tax=Salinigranum salinum TaxID=1364937 RepID=UPI0012608DF8|nr:cytochrome c oxidase subunit II [Salinigranum salinum]